MFIRNLLSKAYQVICSYKYSSLINEFLLRAFFKNLLLLITQASLSV
jgi:hypothetical protein